jgi:hypothetical protein
MNPESTNPKPLENVLPNEFLNQTVGMQQTCFVLLWTSSLGGKGEVAQILQKKKNAFLGFGQPQKIWRLDSLKTIGAVIEEVDLAMLTWTLGNSALELDHLTMCTCQPSKVELAK